MRCSGGQKTRSTQPGTTSKNLVILASQYFFFWRSFLNLFICKVRKKTWPRDHFLIKYSAIELTIVNRSKFDKSWKSAFIFLATLVFLIFPLLSLSCPHSNLRDLLKLNLSCCIFSWRVPVGDDVENRKPSYTVGGNINWCSHYREQ